MTTDDLQAVADRCVKCGLCLPHCPTYQVFRDESESPRGRISLIQGLLEGRLGDTPALRKHLDHCLLCRNCETACPSLVEYGALMQDARATMNQGRRTPVAVDLFSRVRPLSLMARLGRAASLSGFERLLPHRFRRMTRWAGRAAVPKNISDSPRPIGDRDRVILFTGCASGVFDRGALSAAQRVLGHLGFDVVVTGSELCCGAMHWNAGAQAGARRRSALLEGLVAHTGASAVLSIASGCGAHLFEHAGLKVPVRDVSAFLAEEAFDFYRSSAGTPIRVLLHQPCSLRNVMKEAAAVGELTRKLTDSAALVTVDEGCCGGAGMHLVSYPGLAEQLVNPIVSMVREQDVQLVLTSNTGCALHLDSALDAAGLSTRVCHPIEYLAERLGLNDDDNA